MTALRNGQRGEGPGDEPPGARGVFETVLLRAGQPVFYREHMERFVAGCAHFGLARAPAAATLAAAAADLVGQTGITEGVLRWAAWSAPGSGEEWAVRIEPPRPHMRATSWRVAVSAVALPPPGPETAAKHLDRAAWREALAAARAAGWDEVLLADGAGRLVEGGSANVFLVRDGGLATPALGAGPLPGIIRAKVIELGRQLGLAVDEGGLTLADAASADELIFTNSLVGLRPVSWLEGRDFAAPGPVTRRLQAAWHRRYGWV
jgi:branched-subunit amino acid aminotransferase/4-amino-4-deoxychorismate lyase